MGCGKPVDDPGGPRRPRRDRPPRPTAASPAWDGAGDAGDCGMPGSGVIESGLGACPARLAAAACRYCAGQPAAGHCCCRLRRRLLPAAASASVTPASASAAAAAAATRCRRVCPLLPPWPWLPSLSSPRPAPCGSPRFKPPLALRQVVNDSAWSERERQELSDRRRESSRRAGPGIRSAGGCRESGRRAAQRCATGQRGGSAWCRGVSPAVDRWADPVLAGGRVGVAAGVAVGLVAARTGWGLGFRCFV